MKVIGEDTIFSYADGIVFLSKTREEDTHLFCKLIEASKNMEPYEF